MLLLITALIYHHYTNYHFPRDRYLLHVFFYTFLFVGKFMFGLTTLERIDIRKFAIIGLTIINF